MKIPSQSSAWTVPVATDIAKARYVGSAEHKTQRWWGGLPGVKTDKNGKPIPRKGKQRTTICDLVTEKERDCATKWVQGALRARQWKVVEGDKVFPKHIWYMDAETGRYWQGFCVNGILGTYKGWPSSKGEIDEVFD